MSPHTNGRFQAPDPTRVDESDLLAAETLSEYRTRVKLIDRRGKTRWRWRPRVDIVSIDDRPGR